MNWPSSNTFIAVRSWAEHKLSTAFDPRETSNVVRVLLEEVSQQSRALLLVNNYKFSESELNKLNDALKELVEGKPLQHVLGHADFLGFNFFVTKDTLAPRPETEELVQQAVQSIPLGATVVDIGTGTGCIAVSLKALRQDLIVAACDVSKAALAVAKTNADRMGVEVEFLELNILTEGLPQTYKVIISNPPYIPNSEANQMDDRVVKHEPSLALFVENHEPLVFYERILQLTKSNLAPTGQLYFECHEAFAKQVHERTQIFFESSRLVRDLQGKNRMVIASNKRDHQE